MNFRELATRPLIQLLSAIAPSAEKWPGAASKGERGGKHQKKQKSISKTAPWRLRMTQVCAIVMFRAKRKFLSREAATTSILVKRV